MVYKIDISFFRMSTYINPMDPKLRTDFEKKVAEIQKITKKHTVESLTAHAGEYLKELESHLIQRNGIYEGKIVQKKA